MAVIFAGVAGSNVNGLEATASLFDPNAAYTSAFWIRFTSLPARTQIFWACYNASPSNNVEQLLLNSAGNGLEYGGYINGTSFVTGVLFTFSVNTWYHIALSRASATSITIYVNGSSVGTFTTNVSARLAPHNWTLGCAGSHSTATPSESKMEYMRVWTTNLSLAEVQAEMASETRVKNTNVWGDWPLVANANDVSGANSTLTTVTSVSYDTTLVPISKTAFPPLLGSAEVDYTHGFLRNNVLSPVLLPSTETMYTPFALYRQLLGIPLLTSAENLFLPILKQGFTKLDLGVSAQSSTYRYNGVTATEIELTYHPKQTYTGRLWQTKSEDPIKAEALKTRETLISPETAEGFKIVPFTISAYGVGGSTFTAIRTDTLADVSILIRATFVQEGQQIRLRFENPLAVDVTVTAQLWGFGYYSKDAQKLLIESPSLITQNSGFHRVMRVNLALLSDEIEAEALAQHYLDVLENQIDGIFSATYNFGFNVVDDSRVFLFGLHIGAVMRLREEQSMVEYSPFLILGESINYDPESGLKLVHTLLPVEA